MAMVSYKCRPYIQLLFYFSSDRFHVVLVDELVTIACKNINTACVSIYSSYRTLQLKMHLYSLMRNIFPK